MAGSSTNIPETLSILDHEERKPGALLNASFKVLESPLGKPCNMLTYRKRKPPKRESAEPSQRLFPRTQPRRMQSKRTSLLFSHTFKGKQTPRLITVFVLKEPSLAWKNERDATAHIASDLLSLRKRTLFSGYPWS